MLIGDFWAITNRLALITVNRNSIENFKDNDLPGSLNALRRAANRARQVAAQTGTALIVWRDEQIVRVTVTEQEVAPKHPAG